MNERNTNSRDYLIDHNTFHGVLLDLCMLIGSTSSSSITEVVAIAISVLLVISSVVIKQISLSFFGISHEIVVHFRNGLILRMNDVFMTVFAQLHCTFLTIKS